MQNFHWISWKIAPKASNMPSQDVWKFTSVSYRTSALWNRCPALTLLFQLITSSRASGTADHVRSLDDLFKFIKNFAMPFNCHFLEVFLYKHSLNPRLLRFIQQLHDPLGSTWRGAGAYLPIILITKMGINDQQTDYCIGNHSNLTSKTILHRSILQEPERSCWRSTAAHPCSKSLSTVAANRHLMFSSSYILSLVSIWKVLINLNRLPNFFHFDIN